MGSMLSMIDVLIVGSSIYVLYVFYQLKFMGEIKEGLLLPKGVNPKHCKNKAAYIAEMSPKVLVYGIAALVCGILGIFEDVYHMLGNYYLLVLIVFVGITAWFAAQGKKAVKKYW